MSSVKPKNVTNFLQSWNSDDPDKCMLGAILKSVHETNFISVDRITVLLNYILEEDNKSIEDIENFPLLVHNNSELMVFRKSNDLILSYFHDLLPGSKNKFVNKDHVSILENNFLDNFLKLDIETFVELLPSTLERRCMRLMDQSGGYSKRKKKIHGFKDSDS